ncbi:hydantoinase B/oxoprolinase family protein [Telluria beijingensis]|uniref:hydantoinase B/oxoprolinase family protein n=1 Tax=Telluria beijingensis TaxID=3068633 RepID=UPI0027961D8B|nr:hydantoinase B/oxoprolinase family protein [Massilia sp. REN29]
MNPILLELMYHKFKATTEEMGIALGRTALSSYVKETQDFGTALCNLDGKFFACPFDTGIAISADLDCKATLAAIDRFEPGDVIITNHPYLAGGLGSHLPDINLLMPYFHEGELICFGWTFAHCADIGGGVPSSISPSFNNLFQEGLQIPPLKLVESGKMNEAFVAIFRANSRMPDVVMGDLKAQLAALSVGERRLRELIAQHGVDTVKAAQSELIAYARRRALTVQARIPDGVYTFCDYLDDDFLSRIPVRLRCTMTVKDGHIHLDLEGTDPQLASPYNVPTGGVRHPYFTAKIMHLLFTYDRDLPLNAGLFENITVAVPAGTVMNPEMPAAVGIRHAAAIRFADVLLGCLAQASPAIAPAASGGTVIPVVVSQPGSGGRRTVSVVQALAGGAGGTARADGADGRDRSLANVRNTPTERGEADVGGVRIEEYLIRPDSGGAGRFRGGAGIVYSLRALRDDVQILGRGLERFVFRPWGGNGGFPGMAARVILNRGSADERELGKIDVIHAKEGDLLTIMTPGGGGWGHPFERPLERVLRDVRCGFVSVEAARSQYGVVLDARSLAVDEAATRAARLQAVRGIDPMRARWEEVFDDELMTALAGALLAVPAASRSAARLEAFERVMPGIGQHGAVRLMAADVDPGQARARLKAVIADLRR